jgi:predicted MFS family arabinose efflux permease
MTAQAIEPTVIDKLHVWLLIGSGVIASAQIGKAIISMPLIRAELGLGFDLAGLLVAVFATLGAIFGIGAGALVQYVGLRRALIGGMGIIAAANIVGALAPNSSVLLLGRVVEGVGYFGVVLAVPAAIARLAAGRDRDFFMAVWTVYMPIGIMLMLLSAPLLPMAGWRAFWLASSGVAAGSSLGLAICAPPIPRLPRGRTQTFIDDIGKVATEPTCLLLGVAFFMSACQLYGLTFALPLLLTSEHGVTLGHAGLMSAAVLLISACGHFMSGVLLRRGVPIWAVLIAAFASFALAGAAVYVDELPPAAVALFAALALGFGGMAPGALYAAAPRAAPRPSAVPPAIGVLQQASGLGQFVGPVALGIVVQRWGWSAAPAIVIPTALCGVVAAFAVRIALQWREPVRACAVGLRADPA